MIETLIWWSAIQLVGLVAFPLTFAFFQRLPDRGYAFAKPLGLVFLGYILWMGATIGLFPNGRGAVILILAVLAIVSFIVASRRWREMGEFLSRRWVYVLFVEALFAAALIIAAFLRSYVSEIAWTEKPMDIAFLTAVTRARQVPRGGPLAGRPFRPPLSLRPRHGRRPHHVHRPAHRRHVQPGAGPHRRPLRHRHLRPRLQPAHRARAASGGGGIWDGGGGPAPGADQHGGPLRADGPPRRGQRPLLRARGHRRPGRPDRLQRQSRRLLGVVSHRLVVLVARHPHRHAVGLARVPLLHLPPGGPPRPPALDTLRADGHGHRSEHPALAGAAGGRAVAGRRPGAEPPARQHSRAEALPARRPCRR